MEDIKQAYKQLGLEPFADKEEVEKRYSSFIRKERARSKLADHESANEDNFDFAKITEAYRAILDYETKKYTEAYEAEEYGKYKRLAGPAKKFDHFWRYYKIHTFAAIAIIAIIIYSISAFIDKQEHKRYLASLPPVDVQVSFIGNFFNSEENGSMEPVNEKFLADFSHFQRFDSDIIYVPQDPSMQYAYLQKAVIMLFSETPDIYIMDEDMYNWLVPQGVLAPLEHSQKLSAYTDNKYALKSTTEEDPTEHVYAFDVTKSTLKNGLPLSYPKLIIGMRTNAPNADKAMEFIEAYVTALSRQ